LKKPSQIPEDVAGRKVVHLIHLDGYSGGPRALSEFLRFFHKDFSHTVLHGGRDGLVAETCDSLEVSRIRVPIERPLKALLGIFPIARALRQIRPDLLILHGQWAALVGALAARLAAVPKVLYIAHWPAFYTDWDWWRVNRNYICEHVPCRVANKVVTVSESSRYQYLMRGWVDESQLVAIPNALDFSRLPSKTAAEEIRRQHQWDPDACHVVSVGRLADQKRVDWLIRSWVPVAQKYPSARLWIVGDGKERKPLEQLARDLGLDSSCAFLGARENGVDYIAAADIVAATSMYEAFGIAALEGMACGKPVVASSVDGLRDLLRDSCTGFLVAPGDTARFAECICRLVEDVGLRSRMGGAARVAAGEFEASRIFPQYKKLMTEMLQ
jgi:glycosyltransferase involved in cell wall biosynthesis